MVPKGMVRRGRPHGDQMGVDTHPARHGKGHRRVRRLVDRQGQAAVSPTRRCRRLLGCRVAPACVGDATRQDLRRVSRDITGDNLAFSEAMLASRQPAKKNHTTQPNEDHTGEPDDQPKGKAKGKGTRRRPGKRQRTTTGRDGRDQDWEADWPTRRWTRDDRDDDNRRGGRYQQTGRNDEDRRGQRQWRGQQQWRGQGNDRGEDSRRGDDRKRR